MILQLDPLIPVYITGYAGFKDGSGYALAIIDYSQEHDLYFVVGMDETGEIWTINNKFVRLQKNMTLDRGMSRKPMLNV